MQFLDSGIRFLSTRDEQLRPLLGILEPRERPDNKSLAESLMRSIISQQLSTRVAAVIWQRFQDLFSGQRIAHKALMKIGDDELRNIGLSYAKLTFIRNVSSFFASKEAKKLNWDELADQVIIDKLVQIKGVGEWTVQMLLIFHMERPDVWPVNDLGVQQSFARLKLVDPKDKFLKPIMAEAAQQWAPHRSTAALALWNWKNQGYPEL